jgi:GntR family transcriptional regulator
MATTLSYLDLADALEEEIRGLEPGDRLASEHQLAATHGVNRLTARAALQELERRNLVQREQGRGTFVSERIEYRIGPDLPPSWSRGVRLAGVEPRSQTESLRRVRATRLVREELGLDDDATVIRLTRRRFVNDRLAAWAESFVAADLVPDLRRRLAPDGSLHDTLVEAYGLVPVRAWMTAELEVAPRAVADRLGLRTRQLSLRTLGRTDCARTGRAVELTTTWMRADLFRVVFELGSAR